MDNQQIQLLEAKQLLEKVANGVQPLTDQQLEGHHFLHDPRIIRPLFLLLNHLNGPKKHLRKHPRNMSSHRRLKTIVKE